MTARLQEQSDRRMRDNQTQPGHVPVLLDQVIDYLSPAPGKTFIDATFGGGGHAAAILEASAPDGRLLAIDADPDAVARARRLAERYPGRLEARQGSFAHLRAIAAGAGFAAVDGVLMDLGVSSYQLDTPARGFSFRFPAPLDMRFDPTAGEPASTLVNTLPEEDLARLLYELGEEPKARRIARAIVEARADQPIETTARLAAIVERAAGGRRGRHIHPATKTFQALRMAVNRELDALQAGLADALALLTPGGRLVVISFHSLEDRMVKTFFRREARDCVCPPGTPVCTCGHRRQLRILTAKPVRPDAAEQARNPRSRSARLRAAERLS